MTKLLISLACLALASCQSVTPAGKYERSDHHEMRREKPAPAVCADCDPPHNLPVER